MGFGLGIGRGWLEGDDDPKLLFHVVNADPRDRLPGMRSLRRISWRGHISDQKIYRW